MSSSVYPVHVEAALDSRLSHWLCLVKGRLLALPHYLLLLVSIAIVLVAPHGARRSPGAAA